MIDYVAVVVDCFYMAILSTLSSRLTVILVWFSFGSSLTEEDRFNRSCANGPPRPTTFFFKEQANFSVISSLSVYSCINVNKD